MMTCLKNEVEKQKEQTVGEKNPLPRRSGNSWYILEDLSFLEHDLFKKDKTLTNLSHSSKALTTWAALPVSIYADVDPL